MNLKSQNFRGMLMPAVALTATWGLFTGWSEWSWLIGIPVIILGLTAPRFLPALPAFRIRPAGAARFVVFFVRESIAGGIDVGARAVHPKCPIDPGIVEYPLRMTNGFAVMFFANSISLLPGTLSVNLQDRTVLVHALDRGLDVMENLRVLEGRVADLFSEELKDD